MTVNKALHVLLVALSIGSFGCSGRESTMPSSIAPANVFELDISGRKLVSPQPAQLRASLGNVSLFDFGFMTSDQSEAISVNGRLPITQVDADSFVLGISNGPMADGIASVQFSNIAGVPDLTGGTVRIGITPNAVKGEITLPS